MTSIAIAPRLSNEAEIALTTATSQVPTKITKKTTTKITITARRSFI